MVERPDLVAPVERATDPLDSAALNSERERDIALHNHRMGLPKAEYNSYGEKVCLECGITIPALRAAIDVVVRCIDCQELAEMGPR